MLCTLHAVSLRLVSAYPRCGQQRLQNEGGVDGCGERCPTSGAMYDGVPQKVDAPSFREVIASFASPKSERQMCLSKVSARVTELASRTNDGRGRTRHVVLDK